MPQSRRDAKARFEEIVEILEKVRPMVCERSRALAGSVWVHGPESVAGEVRRVDKGAG
jgi:hypothetical protein